MRQTAALQVQWKGMILCSDVACQCGQDFHIDTEMPSSGCIKCPACQAVYKLPDQLTAVALEPDDEDYLFAMEHAETGDSDDGPH
jgi:hypothetical protein